MPRVPALVLLLLLTACEARLAIGSRCARSSECADGLVCGIGGYCREECVTSRDCALGARCLPDPASGLRTCSLPSVDDGCTAGSCQAGLLCVEETCLAICRDDTDCPDGRCAAGSCAPPDAPEVDAGMADDAGAGDAGGGCTTTPGAPLVEVAVGTTHACARTETGEVWCWGDALAVGNDAPAPDCGGTCFRSPVRVEDADGPLADVQSIAAGAQVTCAVLASGEVRCWGDPELVGAASVAGSRVAVPVELTTGARIVDALSVAVGGHHACALRRTGAVVCWGQNGLGQLGNGTTMASLRATPATELPASPDVLVAAAWRTMVGASGVVSSVGEDDDGELGGAGLSAGGFSSTRVDASRVSGVSEVLGSEENTCVRTGAGVLCWGRQSWVIADMPGELCGGTCTVLPVSVPIDAGVVLEGLVADPWGGAVLGWTPAGDLVGWGGNYGSVLDSAAGVSVVPTISLRPLLGGRTTHAVAISSETACAVLDGNGEVWCWGDDTLGELGREVTAAESPAASVCWR